MNDKIKADINAMSPAQFNAFMKQFLEDKAREAASVEALRSLFQPVAVELKPVDEDEEKGEEL